MTDPASADHQPAQQESLWTRWLNTQRVHIPAGEIRFLRTGQGPTVVLLHGLRTQLEYFIPLLDALDRNLDIVIPDLPGHGRSSAPSVEYTAGYFTDAVEQLLDRLDLNGVLLVGESIGASIGLGLAARRSSRIAGLIAINPYDYGQGGGTRRSSPLANLLFSSVKIPAIGSIMSRSGTRNILRQMMEGGLYDPRNLSSDLLDEMWESGELPGHARAFRSLTRHWEGWIAARAEYPRIEVPVTLVYGDQDWSRPGDRQANHRALQTARMLTLARGGHFSSLDQPREIARLIRDRITIASAIHHLKWRKS